VDRRDTGCTAAGTTDPPVNRTPIASRIATISSVSCSPGLLDSKLTVAINLRPAAGLITTRAWTCPQRNLVEPQFHRFKRKAHGGKGGKTYSYPVGDGCPCPALATRTMPDWSRSQFTINLDEEADGTDLKD
jgi:hypothetical protein